MKKIMLLGAFCVTTLLSFAQPYVTVQNSTGGGIVVGVQFGTLGTCTPLSDQVINIPDGNSQYFEAPPGQVVLRVGVSGTSGSGFEYDPCSTSCTGDMPGTYTFDWGSCLEVEIF